jgi:hypothetical protein
MNLKRYGHGAALAFPLAILASLWCLEAAALNPPLMAVDPNWPKPLPNGWVVGQVGGTCIDSQDHVFIVTRGFQTGGLTSPEGVGGANPNTGALGGAFKSRASPPVIEFDPAGNMVNAWGNPALVPAGQPNAGQNAVLPNGIHGCYVDYQDNVWIGGNGDGVVQKYTHDGSTLLLQIGTKFVCDRPDLPGGTGACANGTPPQTGNSQTLLNLPAAIAVDPNPDPVTNQPGSVYIADGYGNHRVVVFDAAGNYLRQMGSVGTGPDQFTAGDGGHPHCVRLGADQLIYACDRGQNKINVYQDGTFVGNIGVIPGQVGTGQEVAAPRGTSTSPKDPAQTWAFISDSQNEILWTFSHATALTGGTPVAGFGGFGHDPGLFSFLHMMAIDSKVPYTWAKRSVATIQGS